MKKFIPFILLIILATSCSQKSEDGGGLISVPSTSSAKSTTICESNSFSGITSVSGTTDLTTVLNWDVKADSLGYLIFKKEGSIVSLISTQTSEKTSFEASGLTAETSYEFLVKAISSTPALDCNTEFTAVTTTARTTFASCKEMHDFYNGSIASGIYEIDFDYAGPETPINVYCEMDLNGGGWTRILYHDVNAGVFANNTQAAENNVADPSANLYSILSKVEQFKSNGKFKFWLNYPGVDTASGGNTWEQTSNPLTEVIAGYTPIAIDNDVADWGGIAKSANASTFLDGSPSSGNQWFAIGCKTTYSGPTTIPGPNVIISYVVLYVR